MERDNTELGTAPIGPLLFKLAVPTVVAQIINLLYQMCRKTPCFSYGDIRRKGLTKD